MLRWPEPDFPNEKVLDLVADHDQAMTDRGQRLEEATRPRMREGEMLMLHVHEPRTREACRRPRIHQRREMVGLDDIHPSLTEQPPELENETPVEAWATAHDVVRHLHSIQVLGEGTARVQCAERRAYPGAIESHGEIARQTFGSAATERQHDLHDVEPAVSGQGTHTCRRSAGHEQRESVGRARALARRGRDAPGTNRR